MFPGMGRQREEMIHVLDRDTINQIAAGEVIERPASVVKELTENAIDAGATMITVEIKGGGIDFVRVTDNGSGIAGDEIETAFLPHATSKIEGAEDLSRISSLGFRGEALPSIAAVAKVEVITKRREDLSGTSYEIAGSEGKEPQEIGAPNGTTFLVRDLFFNTPARRKFLKSAMSEASAVGDLLERLALSRPDISVRFINNGVTRLSSSGNGLSAELIHTVYGKDTAKEVLPVESDAGEIRVRGFIGKPVIAKGNRGFENFFVNGRYVRSAVLTKAVEEGYKGFMMQHRYPLTVLYLELPAEDFDVNVHPAKLELRFRKEAEVYDAVLRAVRHTLKGKELIPEVQAAESAEKKAEKPEEKTAYRAPEPFEERRLEAENERRVPRPAAVREEHKPYGSGLPKIPDTPGKKDLFSEDPAPPVKTPEKPDPARYSAYARKTPESFGSAAGTAPAQPEKPLPGKPQQGKQQAEDRPPENQQPEKAGPGKLRSGKAEKPEQGDLFAAGFLSEEGRKKHRLIGQVFGTYWLIQMEDSLYILDQHAAHEKVLYERKMKALREKKTVSQTLSPPVVVRLTSREELILNRYMDAFDRIGYQISAYGGRSYAITAVPDDLYGLDPGSLFQEILGGMEEGFSERNTAMILEKVASMSCKAAVKGNHGMSEQEADALIGELMTLENPYACPHGRPTLISISRTELEKKFKRIV